jgi:PRTRC genetic system protein E
MFKELAPVLRHRAVLMTITSTEDDQIRVNVVPKKLKDDENKALTTPLTVTGAAEELDAELGQTLVDFVGSHLQLKNTLVQVSRCTQMPENALSGPDTALNSRNLPSYLYSNPGQKAMHAKRIVSSLYLYPGQTLAGTSSGFYVQQSGISVQ